jgi:hypothetical protein
MAAADQGGCGQGTPPLWIQFQAVDVRRQSAVRRPSVLHITNGSAVGDFIFHSSFSISMGACHDGV